MNDKEEFFKNNRKLPEGLVKEDFTEAELEDLYEITFTKRDESVYLFKAVSRFVGGDLDQLTYNIDNDKQVQELLDKGFLFGSDVSKLNYSFKVDTFEISIVRLYIHIITIVNQYKPNKIPAEFKVKWYSEPLKEGQNRRKNAKKNWYYLQANEARSTLKFKKANLTFGEVFLMGIIQDNFEKKKASTKHLNGNAAFNLNIKCLSVLLRKKGEKIPIDKKDYDPFIKQRQSVWRDIPLSTVLDVRFFFLNTIEESVQSSVTNIFSKAKDKSQRMTLQDMMWPLAKGGSTI